MEDPPAYIEAGNPAHIGAYELALCAEVGEPWLVAFVEVKRRLVVAVQLRLWVWLEEPCWLLVEEWWFVRLVSHSPLIDPSSGSEFGGSWILVHCPRRGWVVPEEFSLFFEHQPLLLPFGYDLIF